jgi:sugar lactone lactonase YvrE
VGADGTLYTADQRNVRIRKFNVMTDHIVTTMAGTGTTGNIGDNGPAMQAEFGFDTANTPEVDGSVLLVGNLLYVADTGNNRIRRIHLDDPNEMIDCIAGNSAVAGYSGDGGLATNAEFDKPSDIELGPDGRLYVADRLNHAVRAIDLTSGIVTTVLGTGTACDNSNLKCPDKGVATSFQLNEPYGLGFDAEGQLYVADTHTDRIIKVILK